MLGPWTLAAALFASIPPSADEPLLILPVDGPEASAAALEAGLARALRSRLGDDAVVTTSEVNVALSAERTKDVLGCDDVRCLEDILGAMGGRWAVGVQLFEGEPLSDVVLIARDLTDATRSFRLERRAPSLMPARLPGLAADLATGLAQSAGWTAEARPVAAAGATGGTISVHTEPPGGLVKLNGERLGKAPLTLSGLSSGEYRLSVHSLGYRRHKDELYLPAAGHLSIEAELSPLRDWQAGAFFGMGLSPANQSDAFLFDTGVLYGRELYGPVQVGGIVGYSQLQHDDLERPRVRRHSLLAGAHISVGGCFCDTFFAELSAKYGESKEVRAAARERLEDEESSAWAIMGARLRAKLLYRTPTVLTAELGLEISMLGVFSVEMFYAPVIAGRQLDIEGRPVDLGSAMIGARVILGWSAFYRGPDD